MKNTYLYAFLFGFFDSLLWGDGFGYSHDTDAAWNEWYDTGAAGAGLVLSNKQQPPLNNYRRLAIFNRCFSFFTESGQN